MVNGMSLAGISPAQRQQIITYMQQNPNTPETKELEQLMQTQTQPTMQTTRAVGDTQNDGKIGFGKKVGNFFKGMTNMVKGMFCDESGSFSFGKTLKTVAIGAAAAALCIVTGGAATPFLVAAGAAMGAYQFGKGAINAAVAKTDAEAEMAWQDIGAGTLSVGLSVAGAKGALKSSGVNTAEMTTWQAMKAYPKTLKDLSVAGYNQVKSGTAWTTIKTNSSNAWAKFTNNKNIDENIQKKYDKEIAKIDEKIKSYQEQLNAKGITPEQTAKIQAKIDVANFKKVGLSEIKAEVSALTPEDIAAAKVDLKEMHEELAVLKKTDTKGYTPEQLVEYKVDVSFVEDVIKVSEAGIKNAEKIQKFNQFSAINQAHQETIANLSKLEKLTPIQESSLSYAKNQVMLNNSKLALENSKIFLENNPELVATTMLPLTGGEATVPYDMYA